MYICLYLYHTYSLSLSLALLYVTISLSLSLSLSLISRSLASSVCVSNIGIIALITLNHPNIPKYRPGNWNWAWVFMESQDLGPVLNTHEMNEMNTMNEMNETI